MTYHFLCLKCNDFHECQEDEVCEALQDQLELEGIFAENSKGGKHTHCFVCIDCGKTLAVDSKGGKE